MYFPFIRGRQYDLLALRELKSKGRLSKKIIPIVEPIKLNPTLTSTVSVFSETQSKIVIISNPKVGSLLGEISLPSVYKQFKSIMLNEFVIIGHHLNKESTSQILNLRREFNVDIKELAIVHSERSYMNQYKSIYGVEIPWINVIPIDNSFRRQLNGQDLVGIDDKFNKLARNADYLEQEREFFSEEHLYYNDEGYIGFSDYSIVGQEYNESGFAPYAVAFHIVYPNSSNALEIMHFVSNTNNDTSDPAGKFSEALDKLVKWYSDYALDDRMNTLAMQSLIQHHEEGTYPGLPTLKKLSIMHHLELVGTLLDMEEQ